MWFLFPVSIISAPLWCWASLISRKDHVGWDPIWCSWNFVSGSVHVVTEQHESDQHRGDANSDISILLMKLGRNIDTTSWSTRPTEVFIQSKGHPPVPLCRGQVSLFATAVVCHTLHWLLPELHRCFTLAHLLQAFCYGALLVSHCTWVFIKSKFTGFWGSFEKLLVENQSQLVFMI